MHSKQVALPLRSPKCQKLVLERKEMPIFLSSLDNLDYCALCVDCVSSYQVARLALSCHVRHLGIWQIMQELVLGYRGET